MTQSLSKLRILTLVVLAAMPLAGCAVGQRPGNGRTLHLREPTMNAGYWLYLPEDYVRAAEKTPSSEKKWPLVVTFHGMKPFDAANPQIREWQQEADRYGFVVCAPELKTPDLSTEYPLRRVHSYVQRDEQATIAIMDDIARRVDIDPTAVLSTSWSAGGYLAHYLANCHPERFSCVAVRQSNFSAEVLDPRQIPKYVNNKIGIFYTENDFKACREESQVAAHWYSQNGFDVTFGVFQDLGHERRPSVAAAFFARTCGATAKTPPEEIARMQVTRIPAVASADQPRPTIRPPTTAVPGQSEQVALAGPAFSEPASLTGANPWPPAAKTPPRPVARPAAAGPVPLSKQPVSPEPAAKAPPRESPPVRETPAPRPKTDDQLTIRVSSTIGIAPVLVTFSAVVPEHLRNGSYFLWTDNGEPICNGVNGQKSLLTPGNHELEVLLTTSDGRELRAKKVVTVLERVAGDTSARKD